MEKRVTVVGAVGMMVSPWLILTVVLATMGLAVAAGVGPCGLAADHILVRVTDLRQYVSFNGGWRCE